MREMDLSEQRLAEALRAQSAQAGRGTPASPVRSQQVGGDRTAPQRDPATAGSTDPSGRPALSPLTQAGWALAVALLAGAVLGAVLALLSVLVPGLLPPLG